MHFGFFIEKELNTRRLWNNMGGFGIAFNSSIAFYPWNIVIGVLIFGLTGCLPFAMKKSKKAFRILFFIIFTLTFILAYMIKYGQSEVFGYGIL